MFGYLSAPGKGVVDARMREAAIALQGLGLRVAGAVQSNPAGALPGQRCDMALHLLGDGREVRISQPLGSMARGCRLDPGALEDVVVRVGGALAAGADVLVVNKFGKQEAMGRGFRPLIAEALGLGVPVLTGVSEANLEALLRFAGGMAEPVGPDPEAVVQWWRSLAR